MVVTTRWCKKTMDPPMPSKVDIDTSRDDDVVKKGGDFENETEKNVVVINKVVPYLDLRHLFNID